MSARISGSLGAQGLKKEFSVRQFLFETDGRKKRAEPSRTDSLLRVCVKRAGSRSDLDIVRSAVVTGFTLLAAWRQK